MCSEQKFIRRMHVIYGDWGNMQLEMGRSWVAHMRERHFESREGCDRVVEQQDIAIKIHFLIPVIGVAGLPFT